MRSGIHLTRGQSETRRKEIYAQARKGELAKLCAGVYINGGLYSKLPAWHQFMYRSLAHLHANPSLIGAGKAALAIRGLPYGDVPWEVEAYGIGRSRRKSIIVHPPPRKTQLTAQRMALEPLPVRVTSIVDAVVDCARWHGVVDGLVAADACLNRQLVSMAALERNVESKTGMTGIGAAREVLVRASALSESPQETRLRYLMEEAGFRDFIQQVTVRGHDGEFIGRVDFLFPALWAAVEYDGKDKYRGAFGDEPVDAMRKDLARQHALSSVGLTVVRVDSESMRTGRWLRSLEAARKSNSSRGEFPRELWSR